MQREGWARHDEAGPRRFPVAGVNGLDGPARAVVADMSQVVGIVIDVADVRTPEGIQCQACGLPVMHPVFNHLATPCHRFTTLPISGILRPRCS